jgi:outer membrane protein TolC
MNHRSLWYLFVALILLAGGVRAQSGAARPPVLRLGLKDAVAIALAPEGNARLQIAEELIRLARARSEESRAALLPNVSAYVGEQNLTRNLEAMGIKFSLPGFSLPSLVGPFNVFDARASMALPALNFGSIRRFQAARAGISQAEAEKESARDEVRAAVARAYMAGLRARGMLEATQADVALAEAVLKLAQDQKAIGTGTGIEVTRAGVQLANQKQRRLVAQNELAAAHMQLLRLLNLNLNARIELADELAYVPEPAATAEQALKTALEMRTDWKAAQKRLETVRLQQSAARMDRLPSVNLFADYGSTGTGISRSIPTRTYGFNIQVPVFDGGRLDARRAQASAQYRQELIQSADLRARIDLEIRLALDSIQSAAEQLKTAEEGLILAQDVVAQAERRYSAGVSFGLEVTDAQTRLERARENRIAALFGYNIARINLYVAMGTISQVTQ